MTPDQKPRRPGSDPNADGDRPAATAANCAAGGWVPTPADEFRYAMGRCADLASALQARLGWPIVALMEPDGEDFRPAHVMLRAPSGWYLDIGGLRPLAQVKSWAADFVDDPAEVETWRLTDMVDRAMIGLWIDDGYLETPTEAETAHAEATAAAMVDALCLGLIPSESAGPGDRGVAARHKGGSQTAPPAPAYTDPVDADQAGITPDAGST